MVQDSFYFGPDNGFTQEQYKELREPLAIPEFEMSGNFVLTSNLSGKEFLLAEHYKTVAAMYGKYRKDISKSTHFRNRPVILKRVISALVFLGTTDFGRGKMFSKAYVGPRMAKFIGIAIRDGNLSCTDRVKCFLPERGIRIMKSHTAK